MRSDGKLQPSKQYEFDDEKDGGFIIFNARIAKNVQGGLQQRKVDVKTIKQYAQPFNSRSVVAVFKEYLTCIPRTGKFYIWKAISQGISGMEYILSE